MNNDNATVAVLRGSLGGPWLIPDVWLAPCLAIPVFGEFHVHVHLIDIYSR